MKTGLFFGSFNPIHLGHLMIANYFCEFTDIEQVWFVVSPHNPLKKKSTLLPDHDRLKLVEMSTDGNPRFLASDIEFYLPKPSYTIDTLAYLAERHRNDQFVLLMGSDNLATIRKWKNYELILEHYPVYVFPRPGTQETEYTSHPNVRVFPAPLIEISSSFIREGLKKGKNMKYFLPDGVYQYINKMGFYQP